MAEAIHRSAAITTLWREYFAHKAESERCAAEIAGWQARWQALLEEIDRHERAAHECLDVLSGAGEQITPLPAKEDVI